MSRLERNWQYAEQYPTETDAQVHARRLSLEYGVEPVSRSVAASLSALVAGVGARSILETGTGLGVSGLALLRYAPTAHLTSIEIDPEHLRHARERFTDAGIAAAQLRLIEGDTAQVLPRLNLGSYDLIFLDAEGTQLLADIEYALQIVRPGGTIAIANAFSHGRLPDPAARDTTTQNLRDLLTMVGDSPAIAAALSPAGDGLLTLVRLEV